MRTSLFLLPVVLLAGAGLLWSAATHGPPPSAALPYAEAGLTEREAAAHLLSRFTFGARPGDVDRVVQMGLETWLDRQLDAATPDEPLERRLASFKTLGMTATEIARTYPNPGLVARMAEGDSALAGASDLESRERRLRVRAYMEANGLRPQRELVAELVAQKLLRGIYSENQLAEVLTDFWFNHFNVALQDNAARPYVLAYERDAIRPHVLGAFRDLLGATARHPAMLLYLDNARSTSPDGVRTTMDARLQPYEDRRGLVGRLARRRIREGRERLENERQRVLDAVPEAFRPRRGINENYARELLELHTLGVDGGYMQADVEAVARAFTGWTVAPADPRGDRLRERMDRGAERAGFVLEGAFLFRADAHDATEKTLLGVTFPAGGGLDEGERVLDLLAAHPATARRLARKIAVRFVSDDPPQALVDTLAGVFAETGGDLRAVVRALAYSPYFWSEAARGAKVKSPYELVVSSLRALDAAVRPTRELVEWIDRMGQPLYRCQAPTGFPDRADHWINAGALLNRMHFGLALAGGRIDGVRFDLLALNGQREPGSATEALAAYVPLLLPERDADAAIALLLPIVDDPALEARFDAASDATASPGTTPGEHAQTAADPDLPARVVGVLLGAPAFQQR